MKLGDIIDIDHSYAKRNNQDQQKNDTEKCDVSAEICRKSDRCKKQPNRFSFAGASQCIVCKRNLLDIGLKLDNVVCSVECLRKQTQ